MSNVRRDTGRAQLPALPPVNAQDPALRNWISAVAERLEVREGTRGNKFERAVTLRELTELTDGILTVTEAGGGGTGAGGNTIRIPLSSGYEASIAIDRFIESIRNTRLYRDLIKRLDDPTRFDHLVEPVRALLLQNIADEAAKRGADIQRLDYVSQTIEASLSMAVTELTAAIADNAAGVRQAAFAFADANRAQAGQITQLEASLGNFYQDGSPGRASLEEQMFVNAERVGDLRAQYTLKVQAGGALAGFGIAAEEVDGKTSSAFIIMADKFAIVNPETYNGGLTNTPDTSHIPFGVDTNGIYMNTNVYVRGNMRVDTGGKTLVDGLRGSVAIAGEANTWSDTTARQRVWVHLGKTQSAPNNNHLVIGDMVTLSNVLSGGKWSETRHWTGSAWEVPGAVFNGSMLVNGSVAASKINTQGLEIKDAAGNVVFQSGISNKLSVSYLDGLGALATRDSAKIGDSVVFPDGSKMQTTDFVNRLSKVTSGNIGNFFGPTAITEAYIGNAAVGTLSIKGQAVTIPYGDNFYGYAPAGSVEMDEPGKVYVTATLQFLATSGSISTPAEVSLSLSGSNGQSGGAVAISLPGGFSASLTTAFVFSVGKGAFSATVNVGPLAAGDTSYVLGSGSIMMLGVKR